jgi:hypothetical protein
VKKFFPKYLHLATELSDITAQMTVSIIACESNKTGKEAILRRIRVTNLPPKNKKILHTRILYFCLCVCVCVCVCSFYCPTCKAHALYYIFVCGLSGCIKFFHIIRKTHNFRKNLPNIKCVLFLSTSFFFLKYFSFKEEFSEI